MNESILIRQTISAAVVDPNAPSNASLDFCGAGWMLDNSTAPRIAVLGQRKSDSVSTDIDMQRLEERSNDVWVQPSFGRNTNVVLMQFTC